VINLIANRGIEEVMYPSYSPSSFDFGTIYSLFPTRNLASPNLHPSNENIFGSNVPEDPLFGLMDEAMLPSADMSDTFFGVRVFNGQEPSG
jgi:hypothetical protein